MFGVLGLFAIGHELLVRDFEHTRDQECCLLAPSVNAFTVYSWVLVPSVTIVFIYGWVLVPSVTMVSVYGWVTVPSVTMVSVTVGLW